MKCVLLVAIAFAVKCGGGNIEKDTEPTDPIIAVSCEAACDNLVELGCEEGNGSPGVDEEFGTSDDVSCERVCENVSIGAYGIPLNTECLARVKSCGEIISCYK
jgi:hypothetical protein